MNGPGDMEPRAGLEVRNSRAVGLLALGIGAAGLVLAASWEAFRSPFLILVAAVALLAGAWRVLDRQARLAVSADGIRYRDWGRAPVPWHEFSGYFWIDWRQNPYLQLVPRRPSELAASFSAVGKLNHFAAGLAGMPRFAIALTPLGISAAELEEVVARHLPAAPAPDAG